MAAATAVVAAAMASVPLFLSSVGTESVTVQAAERCGPDTGATRHIAPTPGEVGSRGPDPFAALDVMGLEPATRWVRLDELVLSGAPGSQPVEVYLLSRDGAFDHVVDAEGEASDAPVDRERHGIWINDAAARITGLHVGDTASLSAAGTSSVPVAGVYQDVSGPNLDGFWCSQADVLLPEGPDLEPPPPLVLVDDATFAEVMEDVEAATAIGQWEAVLDEGLTVAEVDGLVRALGCGAPTSRGQDRCAGGVFDSHLPFVAERSRATATSVRGGVLPVALFATLAGIGLVCAAASLWFDRRQREVRLLAVRGVSPVGLGGKALLEVAIPLTAGAVIGTGTAYVLVTSLGPSSVVERAAIGRALLAGLLATVLVAITVTAVVATRARSGEIRRRRRSWLRVVPWELALIPLTVVSYRRLGAWGVPVGRGADVSRVDLWGLMFPLLFLVTVVAVVCRLLWLAVTRVRAISRSWPIAWYLGIRRIARYRVAVLGLVAASAVAAGVLCYSASFSRSLEATLHAKTATFVGSDTAVRLAYGERAPAIGVPTTEVGVHQFGWIEVDGRVKIRVNAIDPDTFAGVAFWDPSFSDESLDEIVEWLSVPAAEGEVNAVVVGATVPGPVQAAIKRGTTTHFTLVPVAEVAAFPGMSRAKATVFTTVAALDALGLRSGITELWASGDRDVALDALDRAGTRYSEVRNGADVADGLSFLTVSWTFGYIQVLGWLAGLLVIAGVAVYLDARRRARVLGYAFAGRMGLTRSQHRRALVVELTASVVVGCWLGLCASLVAVWLAYDLVDPVPSFDPGPLVRPAVPVVIALALGSILVAVAGAAVAQRRVDRDDPLEVFRAGV